MEEDSTAMDVAADILEEPTEMAEKEEKDLFKVELVVVRGTTMLLEDLEEVEVRTVGVEVQEEEEDILVEHQATIIIIHVVEGVALSTVERIRKTWKVIFPVDMVMSK